MKRLLTFARDLQGASTPEALLSRTREETTAVLGFGGAWLLLCDGDAPRRWRVLDASGAERWLDDAAAAQADEIAAEGGPSVDARGHPPPAWLAPDPRTTVHVPLHGVDGCIGILGTGTSGGVAAEAPTPDQLEHLAGMASQLSAALDRVGSIGDERLGLREVERSAARARMLVESAREFATASSVPELLDAIARRMSEHIGELCSIRLVSADGVTFESPGAIHHPDPALLERARELAPLQQVGESISGNVVETGEPTLIPFLDFRELSAQSPVQLRTVVELFGIRSLLAVPVKSGTRTVGVISMTRSDPEHPYGEDDLRLAEEMADRAAHAIERAVLVRALQKSETRFRRLTESGIIGIVMTDRGGRVIEANDAYLQTLGYSRAEMQAGQISTATVTRGEPTREHANARTQLDERGAAHAFEMDLVHKSGAMIPVLVGATRIDETGGEQLSFVLDLSDRKRAEAALRESEARKAAVMDAALDGIVLMDAEGRITEFNRAAERMFGHTREDIVGKVRADVLLPEPMREAHARGLAQYLVTGEGRMLEKRVEVSAMRKDGTEFPAEVAVVQIRTAGPLLFTGYVRDITARKQAEDAELLRFEKEDAEAANRELEAFSYSVAHDLRAPLRAISGFTHAFLEDHGAGLDPAAKGQLARVIANAERMGDIIDALLLFARVSRTQPQLRSVNLSELATSILDQLRATDPLRSVQYVVETGLSGSGDPHLLRVVLENLLGNAWKFTRATEDARIEFGCRSGSPEQTFFVRDNGAGFDMAHVERLFQPFQRVHSVTQFEGTGIGLATVERIIRRHGGRVAAEGAENAGATFVFTLPAETPDRSSRRAPPRA